MAAIMACVVPTWAGAEAGGFPMMISPKNPEPGPELVTVRTARSTSCPLYGGITFVSIASFVKKDWASAPLFWTSQMSVPFANNLKFIVSLPEPVASPL